MSVNNKLKKLAQNQSAPSLKTLELDAEEFYARRNLPRARWDLPCVGCANSAADAPYPGCPSGESACFICTRNPHVEECQKQLIEWKQKYGERHHFNNHIGNPIDNYKTVDVMQRQRTELAKANDQFSKLINVVKAAANNPDK